MWMLLPEGFWGISSSLPVLYYRMQLNNSLSGRKKYGKIAL